MKPRPPKKPKPPPEYAPLPYGAVVMALDVSSSATGWAVGSVGDFEHVNILGFGVVKPPSGRNSIERTDLMSTRVAYLVMKYEPDEICMEFQDHRNSGKRIQGLAVLGQAQGAIRSYLSMTHRVSTVSERAWTKIGGRNAKKEIRCEHIKKRVPEYAAWVEANPKNDPGLDASDAIGILLYRINQ